MSHVSDRIDEAVKQARRHPFSGGVIVGILVAIATVFLIIQNGESAHVDWLWFHGKAPLWLVLIATLIAGAILWELLKLLVRRNRSRTQRRRAANGQS